jgi:hypothetical protein
VKNFLAIIATIALVAGLIYGIHYVGEYPDLSSVVNAITIKSSPDPDCGSTIVKESVIKIASDHGKNQLTISAASQSKTVTADINNAPVAKSIAEKTTSMAALEPLKNESAAKTNMLISKVPHKYQCDKSQGFTECSCAQNFLPQIQQYKTLQQTRQQQEERNALQFGQRQRHTGQPQGNGGYPQQDPDERLHRLQEDIPAATEIIRLCNSGGDFSLRQRVLEIEINDLQNKRYAESSSILEKAQQSVMYTLDTIRMTARDADTRTASCVAKLTAQVSDGQAQAEITYKVENTTDGDLYVTVLNLQ